MKELTNEIRKSAMRRAWKIARKAAKKYGCKVSEISFSDCLKKGWAEAKKGVYTIIETRCGRLIARKGRVVVRPSDWMEGAHAFFDLEALGFKRNTLGNYEAKTSKESVLAGRNFLEAA